MTMAEIMLTATVLKVSGANGIARLAMIAASSTRRPTCGPMGAGSCRTRSICAVGCRDSKTTAVVGRVSWVLRQTPLVGCGGPHGDREGTRRGLGLPSDRTAKLGRRL
jgi:hypothetical protein